MSRAVVAAGGDLLACLQAFAERRSNPVLSLLGPEARLIIGRKYPETALDFAAGDWRAYYHYHPAVQAPAEHGHFHLFTRATVGAPHPWAHVAGLGMDRDGLPLRWFVVNAWVTDDAWMSPTWLAQRLAGLRVATEEDLLPAWLTAMLVLFRQDLVQLLRARDRAMDRLDDGRELAERLADRNIYQLAEQPIDLAERLSVVAQASREGMAYMRGMT